MEKEKSTERAEKEKGFASKRNTILLSIILVLILAAITTAFIVSKSSGKNGKTDTTAPGLSEQTAATEELGADAFKPDIDVNMPSSQTEATHPSGAGAFVTDHSDTSSISASQFCPICGSTDFTYEGEAGRSTLTCKSCGARWKEDTDKIIDTPDKETDVYTAPTSHTFELPTLELPETHTYAKGNYRVEGVLNLREGPSSDYPVTATTRPDEVLYVSEVNGNWGKTTYEGVECWLNLEYAERN